MGVAYSVHLFNCVGHGRLIWVRLTCTKATYSAKLSNKAKHKSPCFCGLPSSLKTVNSWHIHYDGNLRKIGIMTAFAQVYSRTPVKLSEAGHAMGLGIAPNTFTGLLLLNAIVFAIFTSISHLCRQNWSS